MSQSLVGSVSSVGRGTKAVRRPAARAAVRSSLWAATMHTWS